MKSLESFSLSFGCSLALILALTTFGGCDSKPPEDAVRATTSESRTEEATPAPDTARPIPPATEAATSVYAITPNMDSFIQFTGYRPVLPSQEGGFAEFEGSVTVPGGSIEQAQVDLTVQTTSLFSRSKTLSDVLKDPQFFDIAQYPTSTFVSKSITKKDTGYEVTGVFTLRGVSKDLTFPAEIVLEEEGLRASAEFTINRQDWGMAAQGWKGDLINDEVLITFEILATAD